tara:strand:+ start:340 stop:756 length:417 start_codon:yes stop_codon:yes gene_type:complete
MINKNELRIGNSVRIFYFTGTITRLGESTLGFESGGVNKTSATYELLEPIPLTPEILVGCGFVCIHKNNYHHTITVPDGVKDLHKISIFPTMNEQWHIAFSDELNGYKDYIPTTKIKYLHQLQNLYFCLTGIELEYKP